MKRRLYIAALVLAFTSYVAHAEERMIVIRAGGGPVTAAVKQSLQADFNANILKKLPLVKGVVVRGPDGTDWQALGSRLNATRVEPDHIVQIPEKGLRFPAASPRPGEDPQTAAISQVVPWGVRRIEAARSHAFFRGTGVKVAVLDTGIDLDHPDLAANVRGGYNAIDPSIPPDDDNGHGTHVAGTIAAIDNGVGVLGVAPEVSLYAVKVLDATGSGYVSDIVEGLTWAINNGIQVVNMSFSGEGSIAERDAIQAAASAGIILVAAAGNASGGPVEYPAAYPETIAVSATDANDALAWFSSVGPEIDFAAPGSGILSTYVGGTYDTLSGTSMAAPHVAGVVALMVQAQRNVQIGPGLQTGDDLVAYDTALAANEEGEGIILASASLALPSLAVISPVSGEHFPNGVGSVQLLLRTFNHSGAWSWKLDEPFVSSGPAGGHIVASGSTATITGVTDDSIHNLYVTLVDAAGNVLNSTLTTRVPFTVGLFTDIPTQALVAGGLGSDPMFLPVSEARLGTPLAFSDLDEGVSAGLTPSFPFDLYGKQTLYVSVNGTLSFGAPFGSPTPMTFPVAAGGIPVIAPFWADVDLTPGASAPDPRTNAVYVTERVWNGQQQFIVTWDGVTGFNVNPTLRATFQVVLQEDGSVGMAWDGLEWTGSLPAVAGYNAGDGLRGGLIAGSGRVGIESALANHHILLRRDPLGRLRPDTALPSLSIVAPAPGLTISSDTLATSLSVSILNHRGPWHWRLNEPFPTSGPIGGNVVTDTTSTIITGLASGRAYVVYVALVDANHNMLNPPVVASVPFQVQPSAPPGITLADARIVFRSARGSGWGLWTMSGDGTNPANLVGGIGLPGHSSWSPDGTQIAIESWRAGNWDVWVMNADGTNLTNLTQNPADDRWPAWSPLGDKIAFMSDRGGDEDVWVMNVDGTGVKNLTASPGHDFEMDWSPDGRRLVFRSDRGATASLYLMNADGSNVTRLTDDSGWDIGPVWSPDGSRIAFRRGQAGRIDIWTVNADGTGPTNLTNRASQDLFPAWSPDGTRIVFTSTRSGNRDLWVMNADGSNPVQLTTDGASDDFPTWGPFPSPNRPHIGVVVTRRVSVGETFDATVVAENVTNMAGFQLDALFNPQLTEVLSVDEGGFLTSDGTSTFWQGGTIDLQAGTIRDILDTRLNAASSPIGVSGSGPIAIVRLRAIAGGEGFLTLENVLLGDASGNAVSVDVTSRTIQIEEIPWDVNLDLVVDIRDLVAVATDFGMASPTNPRADVNRDRSVNILDLIRVASHFGESRQPIAAAPQMPHREDAIRIERWLRQARAADDGSETFRRGIAMLERLLTRIRPDRFALLAPYPNPFNPEIWIPFELSEASQPTITIYDVTGRIVRRLRLGLLPAGLYRARDRAAYWDGRNAIGERAASGVYFIELKAGSFREIRRALLRK